MDKSIKVEIPKKLIPYLDDDPNKKVPLLLVFELYRERKLSLRQAADILKITYREMENLLEEHCIYLDFGKREIEEEFQYGLGSK
jgi:predicted HTH domain antitoxin